MFSEFCNSYPSLCDSVIWFVGLIDGVTILITLGIGTVGVVSFICGKLSTLSQYTKRSYHNQLVVSANKFVNAGDAEVERAPGSPKTSGIALVLRTVDQTNVETVLPVNPLLIDAFIKAGKKTTRDDVFFRLAERDMNVIYPSIEGFISRANQSDQLAFQCGMPTKRFVFLWGLTNEPFDDMLSQKARALITLRDELTWFDDWFVDALGCDPDQIDLEMRYHRNRIESLRQMAALYRHEVENRVPKKERRIWEVTVYQRIYRCDDCAAVL